MSSNDINDMITSIMCNGIMKHDVDFILEDETLLQQYQDALNAILTEIHSSTSEIYYQSHASNIDKILSSRVSGDIMLLCTHDIKMSIYLLMVHRFLAFLYKDTHKIGDVIMTKINSNEKMR